MFLVSLSIFTGIRTLLLTVVSVGKLQPGVFANVYGRSPIRNPRVCCSTFSQLTKFERDPFSFHYLPLCLQGPCHFFTVSASISFVCVGDMQASMRSQFGRHVPRILRRQLILQLTEQYLNAESEEVTMTLNECKPSIQRFHGALLFIDISGFTVLSQQLSPEDLKFHINEYFTKMLDIVDKHGGDVIKFAGDALFVIWETNQIIKASEEEKEFSSGCSEKSSGPLDFNRACRIAVTTAVECGLEINEACSDHKVSLIPRNKQHDKSSPKGDDACAFLNVHSGVTIGLMAGIDIGCNDRWEYFLMGEPLASVAMAEAQASTGEIVICPEAHAVLHPSVRPTFQRALAKLRVCNAMKLKHSNATAASGGAPLNSRAQYEIIQGLKKAVSFGDSALPMPCGCLKATNGYCKVKRISHSATNRSRRSNRLKIKLEEDMLIDETNGEIESAFDAFIGRRLSEVSSVEDLKKEFLRSIASSITLNEVPMAPASLPSVAAAAANLKSIGDRVKVEFVKWAHSCLVDDIARHVHDVVRSTYRFEDTSRIDVCRREITKQITALNVSPAVIKAKEKFHMAIRRGSQPHKLERSGSILDGTKKMLTRTFSQHKLGKSQKSFSRTTMNLLDQTAAGFTAEIRSVTVMFVKIDMPHVDLTVENQNFGEQAGHFGSLTKTLNESLADMLLLQRLQSCMEALSDSFSAHGGQLRQFIVDDKGTVCIGTFGLRGAVSDDNAAAALETAQMIRNKLQALGLNCSIGVTLGKAFCGLVGSENRHEYAVMGPSTNLSARLMCKAPPGGIICDREIRDLDRAHKFVTLADIIAKGYKDPVGTFKPVFEDELSYNRARMRLSKQFSHIDIPDGVIRANSSVRNLRSSFGGDSALSPKASDSARVSPAQLLQSGGGKGFSFLGTEVTTVAEVETQVAVTASQDEAELKQQTQAQTHWMVQKLCTGPFYGSSGSADGVHNPLIGRDSEVIRALQFLFSGLVNEDGKYVVLKSDQPAVFVGILGLQGIGKSSVMYAINHQVNTVVMVIRSVKLHVFKTRLNGFQVSISFHPWKCVIKEMLIRMYHQSQARKSTRMRRGSVSVSVDMVLCVTHAFNLMPAELRNYESILGHLGIVPEQPEKFKALKMSTDDLVDKTIEIMFEIMRLYVSSSKSVVMLVCEDIHSFDIPSQLLLQHIWSHGAGMLCLYSAEDSSLKSGKNATFSHSSDSSLTLTSVESLDTTLRSVEAATDLEQAPDFVSFIDGQERSLRLELDLLDRDHTNEIIKTTLTSCGIAVADSAVLSKIYNESGGNPMYAYELAKSVAQMHKEQIDLTRVSVKFKNCHRLEEIICHRFDQLSTSAQSLLKIAAAICCHGSSFKYDMLVFVMMDDGQEDCASEEIVEDLMDIVNSESFLRASCDQDDDPDDSLDFADRDVTAEGIQENLYTFSFNISLEKKTIYELLLGDQKQVVHERIAEYYLRRRKEDPSATHHYHEESLHWQKASNWVRAMACSYHAALHAHNEQKCNELITTAYRMYQAMRSQQSQSDGLTIDQTEWSLASMHVLFNFSISHTEKLYSNSEHAEMTVHQVSQIFNCDSDLLRISLNLEVLMSRRRLLRPDHVNENLGKLEEALQMLLLTKDCEVLNNSRVTQLISMLAHQKVAIPNELACASTSGEPEESYFTVGPEFDSLCLKLMSVYLETYLLQTDDTVLMRFSQKIQFVMEKFHVSAARTGAFHRIHSWSIDLRLNCKDGNFRQACVLGQKILDLYHFDRHSAEIIAFYGKDAVPCALSMISQYLLMSSEWKIPLNFHKTTLVLLEKMNHVESIAGAVFFVVNNLVFLQQYEAAKKVFDHYLTCLEESNKERSLSDGYYLEWLIRLNRFAVYEKEGDLSIFTQDAGVLDEIIKSDGGVHVMEHLHHHHHHSDGLTVQGRGIAAVLADVCALRIIVLWNSPDLEGQNMEELRVYCRAFCGYVRETLQLSSGRPHELMLGKTNTVLTVLHLLQNVTLSSLSFEPTPPVTPMTGLMIALSKASSENKNNMNNVLTPTAYENRVETLCELKDLVSEQIMQAISNDCHALYSVFTLLAISLLKSVKVCINVTSSESTVEKEDSDVEGEIEDIAGEDSESNGVAMEESFSINAGLVINVSVVGQRKKPNLSLLSPKAASVASSDSAVYIIEYRSRLHQLMLNGSCEMKLKLLERYKLFGLALALPNSLA